MALGANRQHSHANRKARHYRNVNKGQRIISIYNMIISVIDSPGSDRQQILSLLDIGVAETIDLLRKEIYGFRSSSYY